MNRIWRPWPLVVLVNLIIINLVVYYFINLKYPLVGHDFSGTIPQMLDTLIHFRNNGLSIQWFTPSFGGGMPTFPNPNNGQFSILQILGLWISPWQSVFVSSVIYISIGFLAFGRFLHKVLDLSIPASILGAVFFSANGFILQRIAVGHLGYQPFPLLTVIILLLFEPTWGRFTSATLLGILFALLLHQSGYFLVIIFALSTLITLPIIYIYKPCIFSWRRIFTILLVGGFTGILLAASKLSAVYSFMRFFPRLSADNYSVNSMTGFWGLIMQLFGTMNLVPLFKIAGLDPNRLPDFFIFTTGAEYGYWEFDLSLSPVVIGLLVIGTARIFHSPAIFFRKNFQNHGWVALLALAFSTWLVIEFTLAGGLFYPFLRRLPILSSMHVNARFASALILPLTLLATLVYRSLTKEIPRPRLVHLFFLINLLTLLPLSSYFLIKNDLQGRIYDITASEQLYKEIRSGQSFEVTAIAENLDNTQALQNGTSNLNLYEPIFGYSLENFHPQIHPGSIWEISDSYLNMTDPSAYVFPQTSGTHPFDRFKTQDRDKLEVFARYYQPDWKLPAYQRLANWISLFTMIMLSLYFAVLGCCALIWRFSPLPR